MKRTNDLMGASNEDNHASKASKGSEGQRLAIQPGPKNSDLYHLALKNLNTSFVDVVKQRVGLDSSKSVQTEAEEYLFRCKDLQSQFQNIPGNVYVFGLGDCNQLGLEWDYSKPNAKSVVDKADKLPGDDSDDEEYTDKSAYVPTQIKRLEKISNISCGDLHTAVCTDSGRLFTWGMSDEGSLGRVGDEAIPTLVDALSHEHIIKAVCGSAQTLALTSKGTVYEWGCYRDAEAVRYCSPDPSLPAESRHEGIQANNGINLLPVLLPDLKNIVEMSCGGGFSYARASSGEVYSWGIGEQGALGRPLTSYSSKLPLKTIYDERIKPGFVYRGDLSGNSAPHQSTIVRFARSIACGSMHVLIVVAGGIVLSAGLNNYKQLGYEKTVHEKPCFYNDLFFEVSSLREKDVVAVSSGEFHSLALTASGDIWGFGRIDAGQLGHKVINPKTDNGGSTHIPTQPVMKEKVNFSSITCGSNHNLATTSTGDVYSWGYGETNALGHGKEEDVFFPKKIDFNGEVLQVSAGSQHSAFIAIP